MADFNRDEAVSLPNLYISVSPAPAWGPSKEEVRALSPDLLEGHTNPYDSAQATSQSVPSAPETAEHTERTFPWLNDRGKQHNSRLALPSVAANYHETSRRFTDIQ